MNNHEWLMEELSILIQNPRAKMFLQNQNIFKEVQRYMILKEFKE